jgi:hypothetical protein
MSTNSLVRWTTVVAAIPAGLFAGFYLSSWLCVALLHAEGKGHSHNDIITIAVWQMIGAAAGGLVLPLAAWLLTKRWKKEPNKLPDALPGQSPDMAHR